MTLSELIKIARRRSDDLVTDYRISKAEYYDFANEAVEEACRRSRLIVDSTTAAICQIALVNATATYALDARVLFVRRVSLTGIVPALSPVSYKTLDKQAPDWQTETGEPRGFIKDFDTGLFRPYPTPDAAYTAKLTVVRLPLVSMTDGDESPEIHTRFHRQLVEWMLYRAYSKEDSEIYSPKKAEQCLAAFERDFGVRSSAQDEVWIEREHGYTEDEGIF